MRHAGGLEPEKIGIVREYHPVLVEAIRGSLFVLCFEEPDLPRGGHVDAAAARAIGDGGVATLIQTGRFVISQYSYPIATQ